MKSIYSVTYKRPSNPNVSHYQNEVRGKATRIFCSAEDAKAFASTVDVVAVRDYTGRQIAL